jgi:hypothetical protein
MKLKISTNNYTGKTIVQQLKRFLFFEWWGVPDSSCLYASIGDWESSHRVCRVFISKKAALAAIERSKTCQDAVEEEITIRKRS